MSLGSALSFQSMGSVLSGQSNASLRSWQSDQGVGSSVGQGSLPSTRMPALALTATAAGALAYLAVRRLVAHRT